MGGCRAMVSVSIHAPAWGATSNLRTPLIGVLEFQSTRPRGARPHQRAWQAIRLMFQSTRPRGARQSYRFGADESLYVSIHAPAWGATQELQLHALKGKVSIHAPAWGATRAEIRRVNRGRRFNPRARVGRDLHLIVRVRHHHLFQSTRPRGARRKREKRRLWWRSFNPRARVGRDA